MNRRLLILIVGMSALGADPGLAAPVRHASLPSVSPDGRRIAYVSERDGGNSEVYVCDAAGGGERRLTRTAESESVPAWSADGTSVLFKIDSGDSTTLWAVAPGGGTPRRLAAVLGKGLTLAHDGRRVAYTVG